MKRISYILLITIFTALSCNRIDQPEQSETGGIPFHLFAVTDDIMTKVANQGYSTVWTGGESLNIFHAPAGSETYVMDNTFNVEDASTGKISGTLKEELDPASSYDWYAYYPYSSMVSSPDGSKWTSGWATIGDRQETQTGNNSMTHLAGKSYPLAGIAKNVPANEYPVIRMKNIASVLAVNLTNTLDLDITVNSISLVSPKPVVGGFAVDFRTEDISVVQDVQGSRSRIMRLDVTGGEPVSKGSSAKFYIGVAPFTAESGSDLVLYADVTTGGSSVSQKFTKTLSEEVRFSSGCIKTVNLSLSSSSTAPLAVNSDDFFTLNIGQEYGSYVKDAVYTSFDGWVLKNGGIFTSSRWDAITSLAPALNGNTGYVGTLTSPVFSGGCGTLIFKYGLYLANDKLSFRLEVKDPSGSVLKTKDVTVESPVIKTQYDFSEEINVSGPFYLEFTNLCPSQATSSKDRVIIFDVAWTNFE